jgi:hypothetical protein
MAETAHPSPLIVVEQTLSALQREKQVLLDELAERKAEQNHLAVRRILLHLRSLEQEIAAFGERKRVLRAASP